MKRGSSICGFLMAGAVAVLSAQSGIGATVQTFSDLASWEAAVSAENTVSFDQVIGTYTPPAVNGWATYSVLQVGQATFTTLWDTNQQSFYINNYNVWASGAVLKTQPYLGGRTNSIHVDLSTPMTAFAMNLAMGGDSGNYTIQFGGNTVNTAGGTTPSLGFIGITSDTAVGSIDVLYTNNYTNAFLDNFRFATASSGSTGGGGDTGLPSDIPEAGSMLCCATGLVIVSRLAQIRKFLNNRKS